MNDWLSQNRSIFQLAQVISWAANHPIISLIILLFVLAIVGSIIQAISRLVEVVSKSILQVPLKLILAVVKFSFVSFTQIGSVAIKKLTNSQKNDHNLLVLPPANSQLMHVQKQQRLEEICQRLAEIHKEQQELLQEAKELLAKSEITSEQEIIGK
ncbi:hypothetical protein CEN44_07625 [Fischerella muscicola CCMEE 5323]|uniref:Uncharacterized protein n=2 Tax=Hapalosiphonaceae TaxID=1892263 RepID=A0A2N6K5H8_FISMU|nr:hypothetical protein [Fischerella sp. FACHB-380]PLZ91804.1 hypothetical protein CEN44_07625 [Fischerella muscicola CCMEE 5323]